jgi:hypothetical protein
MNDKLKVPIINNKNIAIINKHNNKIKVRGDNYLQEEREYH